MSGHSFFLFFFFSFFIFQLVYFYSLILICSQELLFLFRLSTYRNCLQISISPSLFGDGSMKKDLRILSPWELFLHNNYYCEHPVFLNFVEKYKIIYNGIFNISQSRNNMTISLLSLSRHFTHLFFPGVFVAFTHQSKYMHVLEISSNLFERFQDFFK